MRNVFLVCYDISDDKRPRQVYKTMRGFGDHIQLSAFRCDLSPREKAELVAALDPIIDHRVDQVLLVDIGPADGRASLGCEALGRPYMAPEPHAIVV